MELASTATVHEFLDPFTHIVACYVYIILEPFYHII